LPPSAPLGAFVLPILYLAPSAASALEEAHVNQLPDVFELLSQALRAGNSLASGMQLVAKEMPDPAGTEFGRVFHEQNLGLKIEDACATWPTASICSTSASSSPRS
jgi:tight adherence protein B